MEVRGFPTNLGLHEDGTDVMVPTEKGPVNHRVTILTVSGFFEDYTIEDAQTIGTLNYMPGSFFLAANSGVPLPYGRFLPCGTKVKLAISVTFRTISK